MSIRDRIGEAKTLAALGHYEAALILTLVAVAGASRLKYPEPIRDSVAFVDYVDARLGEELSHRPADLETIAIELEFNGQQITIGRALYKEFRCGLLHEAALPSLVKFDKNDTSLSTSLAGGNLTLGRGWLFLLYNVVINDPNLVPLFDDVRRFNFNDLIFVGGPDVDRFEKMLFDRFSFSRGRLNIIMDFVAAVGLNKLRSMSDDQMRGFWRDEVTVDPKKYNMINVAGLCTTFYAPPGPPPDWDPNKDRQRAFLIHDFGYPERYEITDAGLEILRLVLDSYVVRVFGAEPAHVIPAVIRD